MKPTENYEQLLARFTKRVAQLEAEQAELDPAYERWIELKQKPGRFRDPSKNPSFEDVIKEQHEMFKNNPKTTFINAHLGWLGNDLDRLSKHLDDNISSFLKSLLHIVA